MSQKIRWGILSTAYIARGQVVPAIQESRNGEVAAVASRDLEKAEKFAKDLSIPRAYGSYEELLRDPEIDAIYNPLPVSHHAEWSIKCAEAGKPCLCEKPLAANAEQAREMVRIFERHDQHFAEAFMYRFHPVTQKTLELLRGGAVGELNFMRATFTVNLGDDAENNIRFKKATGGGALRDVGAYCVNVMRLMSGEEPVEAKALANCGEVDEMLAGLLKFPGGALGYFGCSLRTHFACSYEMSGTEGTLIVDAGTIPKDNQPHAVRVCRDHEWQTYETPPANHYQLMVEDFAEALLENRRPLYVARDAIGNMKAIDMLLKDAGAPLI